MVLLKNRKKAKKNKIRKLCACLLSVEEEMMDVEHIYILLGGEEPDLGSRYASFGRCSSSRV